MPFPTAYLPFNGNYAQAMRFYEKALHRKLKAPMTLKAIYSGVTHEAKSTCC